MDIHGNNLKNLFTNEEKDQKISFNNPQNFLKEKETWKVREIEEHLKSVYCGEISF
jgi:2-oxoglutarate dehydrogenase complex dehydrogenase (E1) component-like enzyme